MTLSYNLAYQEIILVHPTRRQIFAGKPYSTFWNIWEWVILHSPPAACWRNRVLLKVSFGLSRTRLSWEVFRNYRLHHHKNSLFKKAIIGIIIIWDKIHKKWKHVIIIINPVVGSFSLLRWKFPKKNLVSPSDSQAHFLFPGSSATRHETWWGTWEALAL